MRWVFVIAQLTPWEEFLTAGHRNDSRRTQQALWVGDTAESLRREQQLWFIGAECWRKEKRVFIEEELCGRFQNGPIEYSADLSQWFQVSKPQGWERLPEKVKGSIFSAHTRPWTVSLPTSYVTWKPHNSRGSVYSTPEGSCLSIGEYQPAVWLGANGEPWAYGFLFVKRKHYNLSLRSLIKLK